MTQKIELEGLECLCCFKADTTKIAYVLYPMDVLDEWIEPTAEKYDVSIVVITGMDWDNVFSPWPAPGEPPGSPDFQGRSPEFLQLLTDKVVLALEKAGAFTSFPERTLVGVSMSGLFALWQWMLCDTFANIASLSGSFWYPGFLEWFKSRAVPKKTGKAYFLLGDQESKSPVKAFRPVGQNTAEIIGILKDNGIRTEFQSVPGNHFANPLPRLNAAFAATFGILNEPKTS